MPLTDLPAPSYRRSRAGAATVTVLTVVSTVVVAACSSPGGASSSAATVAVTSTVTATVTSTVTSTVTASPTPAATSETGSGKPAAIVYAEGSGPGIAVRGDADLARLTGAPEAFTSFLTAKLAALKPDATPECPPEVTVDAIRPDGYAIGTIGSCAGAWEIWATVGGSWRTVLGGQDLPECASLTALAFPSELLATGGRTLECTDTAAGKSQQYQEPAS